MKRSIFTIFLVGILFLSTFLQPLQTQAEEKSSIPESISNGYVESFVDELGNTTKLEYLINDNEFRVNTYLNGRLIDYSSRVMEEDGEYSDEIIYNQIVDVEQSESEEIIFTENNVKETYNVNDFIKEESSITEGTTLPRPYSFIASKCMEAIKQCGSLYGKSKKDLIDKYVFDFKKDVALSVVAAAITIIWTHPIVAVGILLTSLGISFRNAVLEDSLNGYYKATRTQYSYYILAKKENKPEKETYRHDQEEYDVHYYNSANGKELTRNSHSPNWFSEDALLNIGIIAY
ncbi:hypothetical protein PVA17_17255 [Lysinibacillus sp. CNPSo 3705]|uniref:hypothetical protein n=1 Tax=Lysinibacillus sp. CNPSo 3705 TaxID=3028148 RepID=UPI00236369B8|nr:hypothetical protein [Lysinibacillus sp. CNPSo 3705]MDD1504493.1 hypothetical protein [Lysinibacillus sp. CNPSo 3705]